MILSVVAERGDAVADALLDFRHERVDGLPGAAEEARGSSG